MLFRSIWLTVPALAYFAAGCAQVIIEKDRLKINTFLKTVSFDEVYYDPNGISEVKKFKSIPADIELEYYPLTNTWKIKTKAK